MTVQQLQQQIGQLQAQAARLARRLELTDRAADTPGHPERAKAADFSTIIRKSLMRLYTEIHELEARLPTPELLSDRAYHRMLALGLGIEAAEAERLQTYREAKSQRLAA
jgi:hypothetical protein